MGTIIYCFFCWHWFNSFLFVWVFFCFSMCLVVFYWKWSNLYKTVVEMGTLFVCMSQYGRLSSSGELGLGFSVATVTTSASQISNSSTWRVGRCFLGSCLSSLSFSSPCPSAHPGTSLSTLLLFSQQWAVSSWWGKGSPSFSWSSSSSSRVLLCICGGLG